MPHFKVILSGRGIRYSFEGTPVVGFFTTRVVRAYDLARAEIHAMNEVRGEWMPGGAYASGNTGSLPTLFVEESFPIGLLSGVFGRKPSGYSFYSRED